MSGIPDDGDVQMTDSRPSEKEPDAQCSCSYAMQPFFASFFSFWLRLVPVLPFCLLPCLVDAKSLSLSATYVVMVMMVVLMDEALCYFFSAFFSFLAIWMRYHVRRKTPEWLI
ncbi:hypothetical protein DFH27DRAFT_101029 [Peziza echinospora]|nr:hypothetical protein DFH27DRAFT_101029 [Peziza echinospora]